MKRLRNLRDDFITMGKDYPIAMLGIIIIAALGIRYNHAYPNSIRFSAEERERYIHLQLGIALVLPLVITWYRIFQKKLLANSIIQILAIIGAWSYTVYLNSAESIPWDSIFITSFILWIISIGIMLGSHQHTDKKLRHIDAQYLSSLIIALFFTGVLSWWIAAIFWSLEYLFEVTINRDYMVDILRVVMGVWWFTIFLSRSSQAISLHYSRLIELFAHYVLSSLVSIYALILISYAIKILISGIWPKGMVVYMTIGYCILGFATLLLLYPLEDDKPYITTLGKIRSISSLPILILGFLSLRIRIDQYGWTINRYLVVAIFVMVLTLCIITFFFPKYKLIWLLLSLIGYSSLVLLPVIWFHDSTLSYHQHRVTTILEDHIPLSGQSFTDQNAKDLFGSIYYLTHHYRIENLRFLTNYIPTINLNTDDRYQLFDFITRSLDIQDQENISTERQYLNWYNQIETQEIPLSGYRHLFIINYQWGITTNNSLPNLKIQYTATGMIFEYLNIKETISFDSIFNNYATINGKYEPSDHNEVIVGNNYQAIITEFSANKENFDKQRQISNYKLYLLIK